ncbi:Arogenate dehydratase 5, chloroplastic [Capsicum annuum]|uniref:Arogenate dehydratase n=1 Tax=Capsicum annuum TaxID=4072 RepID=A0A2G2YHC2_CAPAN|nr:Arogenate dehydratase 5, chloroplastic [Capsicum annuum]
MQSLTPSSSGINLKTEAAAGKAYPKCEAIPCDQFEVAFQAVELWIADRAVLPVENSLGGSIHRAAEYISSNNLRDTAAIASARAADLYNLQILSSGIQDDSSNVTRFVMLAREPIIPRTDRPFKTSIVFAHDKGGTSVLFKVLSAFAFRNISLTKIESRPHRNRPIRLVDDANVGTAKHFEYMFYVDFEASMADVRAQNALAEVQEFTSFLRVLGSYPMDMTPWCPSRED